MNNSWTTEMEDLFHELVRSKKPTIEIAYIMKRTKNAIIGKAHRLMFRQRPGFKEDWQSPSRNRATLIPTDYKTYVKRMTPAPVPREPKRFVHPPATYIPPPEEFSPPPMEGVRIRELTPLSCRFMVGDKLYCGEKIHKQSYCEHHYITTRIIKVS